jgi:glycolate oxidase FAD binding subunit
LQNLPPGSQKVQRTPDPLWITPATATEVAAALKHASDAGQSIIIRGAGTKAGWGRPASRIDAVLDMRRLNRILAHDHGDMTATIEAGASLRDVNEALAIHRQALPLDPPFGDQATIGGLLASNDSGPLRHRYGTPRDLVIGIQLATTDGVLANAGGRVVKNVAGYDLSKLVTGSFGSLAAIVSATFKLAPLPAASKTLRIAVRDAEALADMMRAVMVSQLEPVAFEVVVGRASSVVGPTTNAERRTTTLSVLIRFASLPEVVDAQIEQAVAGLTADAMSVEVLDGDGERALWRAHVSDIWDRPGAIVRASWLPSDIGSGIAELEETVSDLLQTPSGVACDAHLVGRAVIGAGHIRIEGDAATQAAAVERLRSSRIFGNAVIVRGSLELKALIDVWGPHGDRQPLFDGLKRMFDPKGILNAGRGPV